MCTIITVLADIQLSPLSISLTKCFVSHKLEKIGLFSLCHVILK